MKNTYCVVNFLLLFIIKYLRTHNLEQCFAIFLSQYNRLYTELNICRNTMSAGWIHVWAVMEVVSHSFVLSHRLVPS